MSASTCLPEAKNIGNDQILTLKYKFKAYCDMIPVPTKVFSDGRNSSFHDNF